MSEQKQRSTEPDTPEWGPKMLVVERETPGLVCALYDDEAPLKGDGLLIYAARTAG